MRILANVIALGVMASSSVVVAQTVVLQCPQPGTTVEFSDGQRTIWVGQENNKCRLQQKRRDGTEVSTFWYAPASLTSAIGSQTWADQLKPWTLWPLVVGKKIEGRYDGPSATAGGTGSWLHKLTVEKAEKITTPAGTFDTFVVAFEQEGISHRWKSVLRQWYAPQPGVTVKFDYSDSQTQKASGEAVSIKR